MNVEFEYAESALELIRESEELWCRLRVSIRSFSSVDEQLGKGLRVYLRDLEVRLEAVCNGPTGE